MGIVDMRIQNINIENLKMADYNPRVTLNPEDKEFKQIAESIETFGFVEPVIVNRDMTVISGHQRINICKYLGWEVVPCHFVDVNKIQEKQLNLALNKITGKWDNDKLFDVLDSLKEDVNFSLMGAGFDEAEFKDLEAELKPNIDNSDNNNNSSNSNIDNNNVNENDYDESFSLREGEKKTPRQMAFNLSEEQAIFIEKVLSEIDYEFLKDEFKLGENKNGNKLYFIIKQWEKGPFDEKC